MKPNLCIGTAQFGLNYGIVNKFGKVPKNEVSKILKVAEEYGINYLDTAQSYGSSEQILGDLLSNNNKFKIISKIKPHKKDYFELEDIDNLEKNFDISLKKLNLKKI